MHLKYPKSNTDINLLSRPIKETSVIQAGEVYLTGLPWAAAGLDSLFSVLSGRPFVARELEESFGLFSGLGVPGPLTFLRSRRESMRGSFHIL